MPKIFKESNYGQNLPILLCDYALYLFLMKQEPAQAIITLKCRTCNYIWNSPRYPQGVSFSIRRLWNKNSIGFVLNFYIIFRGIFSSIGFPFFKHKAKIRQVNFPMHTQLTLILNKDNSSKDLQIFSPLQKIWDPKAYWICFIQTSLSFISIGFQELGSSYLELQYCKNVGS